MTADAFQLYGTHAVEAAPVRLSAGALSADFVNGNLRTIRHGGTEVLRAIAYIVRDRDWGTYEPVLTDLVIDQRVDAFSVSCAAHCMGPDGSKLGFRATIKGSASGELFFDVSALPESDFETNRCGFCILHPIAGLAGSPVTVEHTDGSVVDTKLPLQIDPWQPFKDIRAITHQVRPSVAAECRMEGDIFEMEDQRNWSDASYKTYVRPLALPWPYKLPAGETNRQTITLRITGDGKAPAVATTSEPVRVALGEPGAALPEIGVVIYPENVEATLAILPLLTVLGPRQLLFHYEPTRGHGFEALRAFAQLAEAYKSGTTLECVVACDGDLDAELSGIAGMVRRAGLRLDAIAVSPSVDRQSTPPGSALPPCPPLENVYAAARRAFPDIRLGGGMFSYFTELNRKRVPVGPLDFITHCTCPIVHAADDLSIMQSLEALPFITQSARAIFGDKPYRIGPSTIAMRQNPYGGATKDNPDGQRIAMANRDPRHAGQFAAAWAIGYAARVASAGLEMLTPSSFAGPFGLLASLGEPAKDGAPRPLFHAVKMLCDLVGHQHVPTTVSDDTRVAALASRSSMGETIVCLANLTAGEVQVDISGLGKASLIMRNGSERAISLDAGGRLAMPPYAIARIG
ncbi:D-apionate lactonase [Mesorhizobium abyssinicae]|uniref:D-apionate lactonase n=1 Tax=Mesorhizobium abyssinicae TaxID=1209958 RepID=UPI003392A6D9